MDRSQRRAAVIKRLIAAGLLCAGVGVATPAPAGADAGDGIGGAGPSNNRGIGRGGSAAVAGTSETVGSNTRRGVRVQPRTDDERHPHPYWCEIVWPQWPIEPPLPYTGNRNGIIGQFLPIQTPVVAAAAGGIVDSGVHASTGLESVPEAPPMAVPPAASPAAPAGPADVTMAGPAVAPPAAVPPPVSLPEAVAPVPDRVSPMLPNLPSATLAQLAAVALPGLAGIVALTALGGFLGYRQAKAGYVLRAAGTARFLQ